MGYSPPPPPPLPATVTPYERIREAYVHGLDLEEVEIRLDYLLEGDELAAVGGLPPRDPLRAPPRPPPKRSDARRSAVPPEPPKNLDA